MTDRFATMGAALDSPIEDVFSITPDDASDLPETTRALILDAAGVVRVTTKGGSVVDLPLQAGFNPLRVTRVHATGTDAGLSIFGGV
jgi:hypothetical protein